MTQILKALPAGTVFLDEVLDSLVPHLIEHSPERGGLLFGPRGLKMVTLFVADSESAHFSTTYTPSASICLRAPRVERKTGLEYKGIIHSHPGSYDRPSLPDLRNAARALRANLHLNEFLMPIVTHGHYTSLGPHELKLPGGKMSLFRVGARREDGCRPERVSCLSLRADVCALARLLPHRPEVGYSVLLDIEGVQGLAYSIECAGGPWLVAATAGYPFTPPLVIPPDGSSVPISWNLAVPAHERFLAAMRPLAAAMRES